ncbi:unnamed protein product [Protopolystoma xenopodis]|uniref:Uncharacterized protein n=1 Tax=Protopolystoma xenopodis TaxID=117903 RepID=A0A448WUL0_9PLAT|nr:unnamed protein product [Protopolystoma xenopodis]
MHTRTFMRADLDCSYGFIHRLLAAIYPGLYFVYAGSDARRPSRFVCCTCRFCQDVHCDKSRLVLTIPRPCAILCDCLLQTGVVSMVPANSVESRNSTIWTGDTTGCHRSVFFGGNIARFK